MVNFIDDNLTSAPQWPSSQIILDLAQNAIYARTGRPNPPQSRILKLQNSHAHKIAPEDPKVFPRHSFTISK